MKILLFGGEGQLGTDIRRRGSDLRFEIVAPVLSEVDIANRDQVQRLADQVGPDLVINSAAFTGVDLAEEQSEVAYRINRDGAEIVAKVTDTLGARLIHISTDYVFPGDASTPYREDDPTGPLGVYGRSKLEGDERVLGVLGDRATIVRTAWLHGSGGKNFVQTMLGLFRSKKQISVVSDQRGSPTWTGWLAETLLDLGRLESGGVIHACCAGETTWYGFAKEILDRVRGELQDASGVCIDPQTTEEAGYPAPRPAYSVLDCSNLKSILGRESLSWQDGLDEHLKELGYLGGNRKES